MSLDTDIRDWLRRDLGDDVVFAEADGQDSGVLVHINNVDVAAASAWGGEAAYGYDTFLVVYVLPRDKHVDTSDPDAIQRNLALKRAEWMTAVRRIATETLKFNNGVAAVAADPNATPPVAAVDKVNATCWWSYTTQTVQGQILLPFTATISLSDAVMGFQVRSRFDPQTDPAVGLRLTAGLTK